MINLAPIIRDLRKQVDTMSQSEMLSELYEVTKKALKVIEPFEDLWYGGWGQENYDEYLNPNNQNQSIEANVDYFYNLIKKKLSINIADVGDQIYTLLDPFKKFQRHVVTELSVIKGEENFTPEIELLEKIEKLKWGFDPSDYAKLRMPSQIPVYDMSTLSRGITTPPHIAAMGYVLSLGTKVQAKNSFLELVVQLVRQIEIKISKDPEFRGKEHSTILFDVFDNFHQFCTQLKNRHAGRDTIFVEDEYDVQDLLHAILKLHFKDVREEEYTPSYAGSSSRVDFLLKNEDIVIEVKKTRQGLADKHIGEQLILDVVHYRNHPNCKSLVCFVYDPESRVRNPRGLEADLKKLTSEEMSVEIFIRP